MGADYSFYVKSIATCALTFCGYIISVIASVIRDDPQTFHIKNHSIFWSIAIDILIQNCWCQSCSKLSWSYKLTKRLDTSTWRTNLEEKLFIFYTHAKFLFARHNILYHINFDDPQIWPKPLLILYRPYKKPQNRTEAK